MFLCFVILRVRVFFFLKEKTHVRFAAILYIVPTETSMQGSSSEGTFFSKTNMIKCLLYMEWIDNICVYICLSRLWKHQFHFIWFNSNTKVKINWLNIFPYCIAYVSKASAELLMKCKSNKKQRMLTLTSSSLGSN